MADVDVPAVGSVKKQYVMGAVALVAGIVGYAYWKRRQAAQSAAAAPADTSGTDTSSVTDTGPGVQGNTGNLQYAGTTTPGSSAILTNADWANAAVQQLAQEGWDPITVREALGSYLAGNPLTSDQTVIVQAAISAEGTPPQGPAQAIPAPGLPTPAPSVPATPKSFHAWDVTDHGFTLSWESSPGTDHYNLYEGSSQIATDGGTWHPYTDKQPGTKYGPYYLTAANAAGKESGKAGPVNVTTTKAPAKPAPPKKHK